LTGFFVDSLSGPASAFAYSVLFPSLRRQKFDNILLMKNECTKAFAFKGSLNAFSSNWICN